MENTDIDDPEQLFKHKFPNFNVFFILKKYRWFLNFKLVKDSEILL